MNDIIKALQDKDDKKALPDMFRLLHDEKPTVVRQCINDLHEVALFKLELCETIRAELVSIDLSKYKDSIAPLIKKDIAKLQKAMG